MLEKMYEKLDDFREVITEEKDVTAILKQNLSAFYNFDAVEDICVEKDALVFGYTHQMVARLGITLKNLNSEFQAITWYSEELKGWFSEGSIFPQGFFFHMAAWHVMNQMPSMARAEISTDEFAKLADTYFSFFQRNKIFTKGYRIIAVYHENVLGCYWSYKM